MYEKILVIESDAQVRRYMSSFLQNCKYRCTLTDKGRIGLAVFREKHQDLIVLDMALNDCGGQSVLQKIREVSEVPIIATSLREEINAAKLADTLDGGADDYVIKPFSEGEFLARIRARLRRAAPDFTVPIQNNIFRVEYLTVDFDKVRVTVHNQIVHLTPTEYRLLSILINNRGRVITYEQMSWELWGQNFEANGPKIRVYIMSLRKKIDDPVRRPRFIFNVKGCGYQFTER